jgi:UDP-GlcNAc:undecaprenyl-phosphate/decaprenyl-phosphate GlcNAc-1-phosphate transferase
VHGDLGSLLAVVICGVFVAAALPVTIPLLRRAAAIDQPNHRSSHTVPTPRGGGITLAIGLIIAALLIHSAAALVFGFTVGVFAAIGWADDLAGLPALRRLGMQAAASLAAGWLLVSQVRGFGTLTAGAVAATVIVAVWLAGFVNVFNFMDGVNGISAAHAILGGTAYFCLGLWRSDQFLATGGAAVVAVSLAFLPWNLPRARVFLGDVGSYGLGAALALLGAYAVLRGVPVEAVLGSLALYLADTAWTLQRRIRMGEQWLQPHRTHTYQRLCDTGWSHQRVTLVTGTVTAAVSLLGAVSLTPYPGLRAAADLAAIALLAAYLRAPAVLGAATASTGKHRIQSRVA